MIFHMKAIPVVCASLLLFIGSESVFAQSQDNSPGNSGAPYGFGIGHPKTLLDLPPGQLKKDLENLSPKSRGKALGLLQSISFPNEDVKYLRVDRSGNIKYADTFLPELTAEVIAGEAQTSAGAMDSTQVFSLHSRPGASNVMYLDFDGHIIEGTAWNSDGNTLVALPFDPSGNDSSPTVADFTQIELDRIAIIWHRMSEDFAAFDIDVTTEEPSAFSSTTGHVLFTHDSDASGQAMPSQGGGGVAWLNVFGRSDYVAKYSPALVYSTNLSGIATYNAEAGSHEIGHNLGLSHDGVINGTSYYTGSGSGAVKWAPIMGSSYSAIVTPWSKGEYANANNNQDDIDIIAGHLGYAGDDHGDSSSLATALQIEPNGEIFVSSPELDPDNFLPENKGIIDDRNDVDWFFLDVAGGSINITVTPAWHSFGYTAFRGANLDIELSLFDSSGELVVFDEPTDRTNANVTAEVTEGRYYLQIDGVGNNTNSDYSDYSSQGMYFLEGQVPTYSEPDTTAPLPLVMSWQTAPHATGEKSFSMMAVQATDNFGSVEYNFSCVTGGNGCVDSGWQTSPSWSPDGLDSETFYSYKVTARDGSGNQNGASSIEGDTTDAPPTDNIFPSTVASYNPAPAVISKGKTASVTLSGSGSSDPDGVIFAWEWRDSNGSTISTDMSFATKLRAGTHDFTLTVTDNDGATDSSNLSVSVTKAGGGDDGGGGGGGKKCNPRKTDCG